MDTKREVKMTTLEDIRALLVPVGVAILGGFVRSFRIGVPFSIYEVLVRMSTAAFAAVVAGLTLRHAGVPDDVLTATCGVVGYASNEVLPLFVDNVKRILCRIFGSHCERPKDENEVDDDDDTPSATAPVTGGDS